MTYPTPDDTRRIDLLAGRCALIFFHGNTGDPSVALHVLDLQAGNDHLGVYPRRNPWMHRAGATAAVRARLSVALSPVAVP